ncbi:MAG TPA: hypothetical protein VMM76_07475 [Pirellulaceae bacterium]|nr:hypothetical protein [Pirellulaceae bacterium]
MNLLFLAPDIQEELLLLPTIERGRDAITERELRPIAAVAGSLRYVTLVQHL